jgi:hypothetical protein
MFYSETSINTLGPLMKGRFTIRLMMPWFIGDGTQVCWMYDLSVEVRILMYRDLISRS